MSNPV